VGYRQKVFDHGEGMIRQGRQGSDNYRKSETLPFALSPEKPQSLEFSILDVVISGHWVRLGNIQLMPFWRVRSAHHTLIRMRDMILMCNWNLLSP
jgi:hypothetical protein